MNKNNENYLVSLANILKKIKYVFKLLVNITTYFLVKILHKGTRVVCVKVILILFKSFFGHRQSFYKPSAFGEQKFKIKNMSFEKQKKLILYKQKS